MENLDIFCEGENFIGITADENSKYINEWYNLFNSEYITRYLDHGFYPNTKSSQLEFIKKTNTHNDRLILLVLSKKTNEFLGTMSLSSINFLKRSCQFGLVLDNRRFKGDDLFIPLEVCSFLISHAFDKLGMLRVWGGQAYPGLKKWNKRLELLGLITEGISKSSFAKGHKREDQVFFSIDYERYLNIKQNRNGNLWPGKAEIKKFMKLQSDKSFTEIYEETVNKIRDQFIKNQKIY